MKIIQVDYWRFGMKSLQSQLLFMIFKMKIKENYNNKNQCN